MRGAVRFIVAVLCLGHGSESSGAGRLVDDDGVLVARRARATVGLALVQQSDGLLDGRTTYTYDPGLSLESAVGIGSGLELGARMGHRVYEAGRALRSDELARMNDTETFGTGLSTFPNPELRIRWLAYRWSWGETGLEDRVPIPIEEELQAGDVLGAWASLHRWGRLRLDVGVNGIFLWHRFARGIELEAGVSAPIRAWWSLSDAISIEVFATPRRFFGTNVTTPSQELWMGFGLGFRFRGCDFTAAASSRNVFNGVLHRIGMGVQASCTLK